LHFGKAENFPWFDSAIVPRWAINPNYEKITLHFSQRRASRSVRTKNRRCRSGELAGRQENRAQYHGRESAFDHGEDQGNDEHVDEYQHHDCVDSEFVEQHDDDHDFEPEPVVLAASQFAKSSRGSSAGRLLLYRTKRDPFPLVILSLLLVPLERSGA
jgi:hypothetical protein